MISGSWDSKPLITIPASGIDPRFRRSRRSSSSRAHNRFRRVSRRGSVIYDDDGTYLNRIAITQSDAMGHRMFSHHRSILAPQVFESRLGIAHDDSRVTTRHTRRVEKDRGGRIAADQVFDVAQRHAACPDRHPPGDWRRLRPRLFDRDVDRIADPVRGAHDRVRGFANVKSAAAHSFLRPGALPQSAAPAGQRLWELGE